MHDLTSDISTDLKLILENISNAILFESGNREIIFVNKRFCELFKIPVDPDQLIGASCANAANDAKDLFKNPDAFLRLIYQILDNGTAVSNQELIMNDGASVFLDYIPLERSRNEKPAHLWIYKNIKEISHFIQTVNQQRFFYENLLNNIPADIAIFDNNHNYLFVNKTAINNDEKRSWIIGKNDFEYCEKFNKSTEGAQIRSRAFEEAVKTRQTVEFEELNYDINNDPVYNLRRFFPVIQPDGAFKHIIGYGINITSIKVHEQYILAREREFKNLIDSMDQMVVTVDDAQLIQYCNPKWSKITGKKQAECEGKKLDIFIKSGKAAFKKILTSFISEGTYAKKKDQAIIIDQRGEKRVVKYYISHFVDHATRANRYAVFMTDITDQVHAETELKKIAKQERRLNELKSNFMNMVSHELRTPLSVILSSTELIELNLAKLNNQQSNSLSVYTDRIIGQVDRMTQLMNDFLFISKVEAGKIGVKLVPIQLVKFIEQITDELYNPWKDNRSLILTVKGEPYDIMADEMMLRHIVVNIINNAFKYSMGKPAPQVRLIFGTEFFQILVIDEGIGIHDEDKKSLFSPFVRGSNVGEVEGTGLGLLVVKYFVELHKGLVTLKSLPQKGTAVLVTLPAKRYV